MSEPTEQLISVGDSLRLLADWYDRHPDITAPVIMARLADSGEVGPRVAAAAKALAPCEKRFSDYFLFLSRTFGSLKFSINVSRDAICKKIVTYDCPKSLLSELGIDAEGNPVEAVAK